MKKGGFLPGAALSALAVTLASPAYAQTNTATQDASAQDAGSGLGDIIVTAQRRSENLQDVPVAITAATGDMLAEAGVENIANIQAISPSITFRATNISSSSANVVIRGLGTTGNSRSFEGSAGVFIDGVYRTRAAAALQNFLDIGSLQILRGPQGTLFGKNTTAGALLLATTEPRLDEIHGSVELGYGNYNTVLARGAVSVPISEHAAFRIAGLAGSRDGFYTNPATGRDLNGDSTQAVKGQLLFEPSSDFTLRLIGDYSRTRANCCYGTSNFVDGPTQPLVNALTRAFGLPLPSTRLRDREATLNQDGIQTTEDYGATMLIDAEIGPGTLKSVSAYRRFSVGQQNMDADFSGADLLRLSEDFNSRFISQELTYNTRFEGLNADAVFGLFFSDEKLTMGRQLWWGNAAQPYWDTLIFAQLGLPPGTVAAPAAPVMTADEAMGGRARSYAGFMHWDFRVGSRFNVIAGLRYSIEEKRGFFHYDHYTSAPNAIFRVLGVSPGPGYDARTTDRALSGTFGLQYRPTDDVMLYATYNRGFKAGGVNMDANAAGGVINNPAETGGRGVPLDPTFAPETINAFELGAKIQYLGGRARSNIAAFYYDIKDLQIAQFVGLRFTVLNADSAKDYGFEIENLFQLTDGLTLGIDGTWIPRARYGVDAGIDPVLSGTRFRYAPTVSGNVTLNLDQPVSDTVNVTGRVQYMYSSTQLINNASLVTERSVSLVNANLGFNLPQSGLNVEGWVQNLFNKTYAAAAFNTPLQTGDQNAYLGAPRTYGVRLRYSF